MSEMSETEPEPDGYRKCQSWSKKEKSKMSLYHRLETLNLHVNSNGVHDGDQISKAVRDDMVDRGFLFRREGYTYASKTGFLVWLLTLPWFWFWGSYT